MARVLVAAQTTVGAYPTTAQMAANARDLDEQAGDASLGNYTPIVEGKTFVIAHNTGVGARTITITSQPDTITKRTGDITAYSIGAGEIATFGPFKAVGWSNAGNLDIDVSHAEVKLAILTLP